MTKQIRESAKAGQEGNSQPACVCVRACVTRSIKGGEDRGGEGGGVNSEATCPSRSRASCWRLLEVGVIVHSLPDTSTVKESEKKVCTRQLRQREKGREVVMLTQVTRGQGCPCGGVLVAGAAAAGGCSIANSLLLRSRTSEVRFPFLWGGVGGGFHKQQNASKCVCARGGVESRRGGGDGRGRVWSRRPRCACALGFGCQERSARAEDVRGGGSGPGR